MNDVARPHRHAEDSAASARAPSHESAIGHVTGRAVYTDEQHAPTGIATTR